MMRSRHTSLSTQGWAIGVLALTILVLPLLTAVAGAPEANLPLSARIDRLIATHSIGPIAGRSPDAEFIRRATLDLNGLLPAPDVVRSFLDDPAEDKRTRLVDTLLSEPRSARHLARVFDVMLMERRRASNVKEDEWLEFLVESLRENRPADQLFAAFVRADGVDPEQRAPARFVLDRDAEPNLLTRDIGRLFFGRDLQCAQCHNHPWIDDYLQPEYYGLYAFVNRSYLFDDSKLKKKVLAEKAEGDVTFSSVFTGEEGETRPRVPGGTMLSEPVFAEAERYEVNPAKNVRPVPRYSRRERLAELIEGGNRQFARNIANRLWAHMMGRGLVDPLDLDHSGNPAAYPRVLELLTEEFIAHDFDVRWLLRELALTETYQRSIELPADDRILASVAAAEQQLARLTQQTADQDALVSSLQEELDRQREQLSMRRESLAKLVEPHQTARAALDKVRAELEKLRADRKPLQEKRANAEQAAQLLAQAHSDSAAALKHFAEDAELRKVHDALAAHAKRLRDAVTPLDEQLAKLDAQLKTMEAQATEQQKAFEPIDTQFQAATEQVRESDAAVTTASARYVEARAWHKVYEQRQEAARRLIEFRDTHAAVETARQQEAAALAARDAKSDEYQAVQDAFQAAEGATRDVRERQSAARKHLELVELSVQQTADALAAVQSARNELADLNQHRQDLLAAQAGADSVRSDQDAPSADGASLSESEGEPEAEDDALRLAAAQLEFAAQSHKRRLAAVEQSRGVAQKSVQSGQQQLKQAESTLAEQRAAFEAFQSTWTRLQQDVEQQRAALEQSQARLASLRDEIAAEMARTFQLASLKPLSPEQMAWSVMGVLGVVERQEQASEAELRKQAKAADAAKAENEPVISPVELERAVFAKLRGHEGDYVRLYGAGAGQPQSDFFATADQALYLANGGKLLQWLAPQGENLTARLLKQEDPAALARELYMSVLIRKPAEEEIEDVRRYLQERESERQQAVQELVWGLLTSSEFRFVH